MKRIILVAAAAIGLSAGSAFAVGLNVAGPESPGAGEFVFTPRGLATTTGRIGQMQTTTLPGGGQGFLMDNGNGTSTLTGPGGLTETVPTPR